MSLAPLPDAGPDTARGDDATASKQQVITTWLTVIVGLAALTYFRPQLAQYALVFVITLSILVFVHEWGHYQFARWAGMKVNRFGIGFPPWIANVRRNGIDYSIGALPIGGMVDIAGLGSEEEMVATAKGEHATDAPRPTAPFGEKNFQDASLGWRFLTLFAGPMMNFIFAMIVFAVLFSVVGIPADRVVTNRVDQVSPWTPADKAGIQAGDRLIGVNGVLTDSTEKLRNLIRDGKGKAVTVMLQRDGKVLERSLTPNMEEEIQQDGTKIQAAIIGIMFTERITKYERLGLISGKRGFSDSAVGAGLQVSYNLADQIFGLLRRVLTLSLTPDDKRKIGGPVKIAQTIGHTSKKSWQETILLAAALSVNLGIMNLLPIPALDGGRIMFLGYELIARRRVDPRRETLVNSIGMLMVLAFMAFMTLRDVLPFLRLPR